MSVVCSIFFLKFFINVKLYSMCCFFKMRKAHDGSTEGSGLGDMFDSLVNHLTSKHCDFLRQWERLIDLEAKEIQVQ